MSKSEKSSSRSATILNGPILDLTSVPRERSQEDVVEPEETLFLPVNFRRTSEELAGNELVGITYRVPTLKPETTDVPAGPQAIAYDMAQFKIGLKDGYHGLSPAHNLNNLHESLKIEKALAYPLRVHEQIAATEAKKVWHKASLKDLESRLDEVKNEKSQSDERLASLRQRRDEFVQKQLDEEQAWIDKTRREYEEAAQKQKEREREARVADERRAAEDQSNRFAKLIAGAFLLCCGVVFIVADIALSIAAIYALGFTDVSGIGGESIPWSRAVFDPRTWSFTWEGVFVCFGIAAITVFFKYMYDRLVYSNKPFLSREKYIMGFLFAFCVITVIALGKIRADYLINNIADTINQTTVSNVDNIASGTAPESGFEDAQSAGDEILGVDRNALFWSMFLTTMLFPLLGAVCLTEGLNRTFNAFGLLVRRIPLSLESVVRPKYQYIDPIPAKALENEIALLQANRTELAAQEDTLKQTIMNSEKRIQQYERLIPVWKDALDAYENRWEAIAKLDRLLYMHGYEQGRILRGQRGAYKIMSGIVAGELTAPAVGHNGTVETKPSDNTNSKQTKHAS